MEKQKEEFTRKQRDIILSLMKAEKERIPTIQCRESYKNHLLNLIEGIISKSNLLLENNRYRYTPDEIALINETVKERVESLQKSNDLLDYEKISYNTSYQKLTIVVANFCEEPSPMKIYENHRKKKKSEEIRSTKTPIVGDTEQSRFEEFNQQVNQQ